MDVKDIVGIVFGGVALLSLVVMAFICIFKPSDESKKRSLMYTEIYKYFKKKNEDN